MITTPHLQTTTKNISLHANRNATGQSEAMLGAAFPHGNGFIASADESGPGADEGQVSDAGLQEQERWRSPRRRETEEALTEWKEAIRATRVNRLKSASKANTRMEPSPYPVATKVPSASDNCYSLKSPKNNAHH